jgi:Homeodomain-like domain
VTGIVRQQGRGTRLGRPRRVFRRDQALRLRAEGQSWRQIARALGVPFSTVIGAVPLPAGQPYEKPCLFSNKERGNVGTYPARRTRTGNMCFSYTPFSITRRNRVSMVPSFLPINEPKSLTICWSAAQ